DDLANELGLGHDLIEQVLNIISIFDFGGRLLLDWNRTSVRTVKIRIAFGHLGRNHQELVGAAIIDRAADDEIVTAGLGDRTQPPLALDGLGDRGNWERVHTLEATSGNLAGEHRGYVFGKIKGDRRHDDVGRKNSTGIGNRAK